MKDKMQDKEQKKREQTIGRHEHCKQWKIKYRKMKTENESKDKKKVYNGRQKGR